MASNEHDYDPFAVLDAPAPPPDVTPVEFMKGATAGFRKPDNTLTAAFASQTRVVFGKRYRHFRHSYVALPDKHIRVLIIRPGKPGDRLELDLMAIPFEEPYSDIKPYEALSYEWDDGPAVFPVILRDYTLRRADVRTELEERFPVDTASGDTYRGSARASAYWKRIIFQTCRSGRMMKKDERGLYIKGADGWLEESDQRFGTIALIQANLRNALEQLRDKMDYVRLWADALSINQPDSHEKMQQIAMMGKIYNRATNVRIWLGGRSTQSDVAMDYVREIQEEKALRTFFQAEALDREVKTKWPALVELMQSRWFSRRWIVQEVAMARRASVYCGDRKVSWTDFSSAVATFMDRARPEKLDQYTARDRPHASRRGTNTATSPTETPTKTQLNPDALRTLRGSGANKLVSASTDLVRMGEKSIPELKQNLEELVSGLTPFDCGDPRDIIYAVLTIAAHEPQHFIKPSINKSLLQTYTEFISYCVEQNESLDMICRYWAPKNQVIVKQVTKRDKRQFKSRLPSWIKTLEHSTYGTPDKIFVGQREADSLVRQPSQSWYKASRTRKPQVIFGRKPDSAISKDVVLYEEFDGTLQAEGVCLGEIRRISPRMLPGIIPQEAVELGGWLYSGTEKKVRVEDVPERLYRTLVADRTKDGHNPLANFRTYCLLMLQQENVHGDIHLDNIISTIDAEDGMSHFLHRVREVCFNRKIFVGDDPEKLLGVCPKQTQVGDLVCVLFGCSVPVVLRRCTKMPTLGLDPECDNDPTERIRPRLYEGPGAESPTSPGHKTRAPPRRRTTHRSVDMSNEDMPWLNQSPTTPASPRASTLKASQASAKGRKNSVQQQRQGAVPRPGNFSKSSTFSPGLAPDATKRTAATDDTNTNDKVFYEVIGECFACDKMNGEACAKEKLPRIETFTLI